MRLQVSAADCTRRIAIRLATDERNVSALLTRPALLTPGDHGQWSLRMGEPGADTVTRDLSSAWRKTWPAALRMALAACEEVLMRR